MTLDTRWKNPQGADPRTLYLWAQDLIRELRKGDYQAAFRQQGKTQLWVPALDNLMIARTGTPAFGTVSTGSSIKYRTLDFDPSSTESAIFTVAMPKSWNAGTVTFVPVWSHGATTINFGVDWQLRGQAISDGDSGNFSPAGQQGSVDTGGTTDSIYQGPESAAITIQGSPAKNDSVTFEIFRNTSSGSDTLAVDARLHGIKLFYTTDAGNDA